MARAKLTGFLSEVSGSISGTSFYMQSGSLVLRSKNIPPTNTRPTTYPAKQATSIITQAWRHLTQAKRNVWQSERGRAKSGYHAFVKSNFWLARCNQSLISAPKHRQPPIPQYSVTTASIRLSGTWRADVAGSVNQNNAIWYFRFQKPVPAYKQSPRGKWYIIPAGNANAPLALIENNYVYDVLRWSFPIPVPYRIQLWILYLDTGENYFISEGIGHTTAS